METMPPLLFHRSGPVPVYRNETLRIIATTRELPMPPQYAAAAAGGRGVVDILMVVGVLLVLSVSGYALEFFGIPYVTAGGSVLTKLHPSLYLFSAALA